MFFCKHTGLAQYKARCHLLNYQHKRHFSVDKQPSFFEIDFSNQNCIKNLSTTRDLQIVPFQ